MGGLGRLRPFWEGTSLCSADFSYVQAVPARVLTEVLSAPGLEPHLQMKNER